MIHLVLLYIIMQKIYYNYLNILIMYGYYLIQIVHI